MDAPAQGLLGLPVLPAARHPRRTPLRPEMPRRAPGLRGMALRSLPLPLENVALAEGVDALPLLQGGRSRQGGRGRWGGRGG